jgi:hypothetical protein
MQAPRRDGAWEILRDVQRRVPAGQRFLQEAFTSDHRHPVLIKLNDLRTDTFYYFDEMLACVLCDAVVAWAARHGGGRLTVSFSAFGEWKAQRNRLQHVASKFSAIRVLTVGKPNGAVAGGDGFDVRNIHGSILSKFRIVLREGTRPILFVGREVAGRSNDHRRFLVSSPVTM